LQLISIAVFCFLQSCTPLRTQSLRHSDTSFRSPFILPQSIKVCVGRYSDRLRAGRSGDRIPDGTRFSYPVQTGTGAHPASCKMGVGSFPGVKSGRGVTLIPHPLLVPWSRKTRGIHLHLLWAVQPVQSLSACTGQLYLYSPYGP